MNKITRFTAVTATLLALMPVSISLANEEVRAGAWGNLRLGNRFNLRHKTEANVEVKKEQRMAFGAGVVTAISSDGFTFKAENGSVYTVKVANAKLFRLSVDGNNAIQLSGLQLNDKVVVRGSITDSTLDAKVVYAMPAHTHPAMGRGTVTAINGNQFTVQVDNHGIISDVTVDTNANTVFTQNGNASASMADVQVGSKVKVKGLWNELLNVLNAIRIKLF